MQYIYCANAIIMSKKKTYLKSHDKHNGTKDNREGVAEPGSAKGRAIYKVKATKGSPKDLDIPEEATAPSLHFLPVLEEERKTYQYNQISPLLNFLGYNQGDSSELLETNASTLSRWKNSSKPVDIGKLRSKIMLDIDEIISKGVRVFGSETLFQEWLNTTNHSLGDVKPVDLLKDVYSIELVEDAIDGLSWGSYI